MSDTPADEGPKQTISRMPADDDIGPHFPSGMSAPEAAAAGATIPDEAADDGEPEEDPDDE